MLHSHIVKKVTASHDNHCCIVQGSSTTKINATVMTNMMSPPLLVKKDTGNHANKINGRRNMVL